MLLFTCLNSRRLLADTRANTFSSVSFFAVMDMTTLLSVSRSSKVNLKGVLDSTS
jgi:hypothetical protein